MSEVPLYRNISLTFAQAPTPNQHPLLLLSGNWRSKTLLSTLSFSQREQVCVCVRVCACDRETETDREARNLIPTLPCARRNVSSQLPSKDTRKTQ
jgi:hypothetical protein